MLAAMPRDDRIKIRSRNIIKAQATGVPQAAALAIRLFYAPYVQPDALAQKD
jgi:hypothetical protein